MKEEITLTEKGTKIIIALQENGVEQVEDALLAKDIAELVFMLPGSVPGVLTSLANKGLVEKTADSPRKYFLTEDGASITL